jgi:RNA polymerase sigma-70 factor, ECF subfamily
MNCVDSMTPPIDPTDLRADGPPRTVEAGTAGVDPDSRACIHAAQAGCTEAVGVLVETYGARILNYLCQLTGNRHDAEDLTQDTFLKAHRGLGTVRNPDAFVGWLFTIARRTALNHFRATRLTEELPAEIPLHGADPASLTAERDERDELWNVAHTLKREYFEVLWLRYAEGLSIPEIARVLQRTALHVRVRLHRARHLLARRLETRGGSDSTPLLKATPSTQSHP